MADWRRDREICDIIGESRVAACWRISTICSVRQNCESSNCELINGSSPPPSSHPFSQPTGRNFSGQARNGVHAGALSEKWASTGPRVIWRKQIGQGLSGPAVAGNRLILFHRIDDREIVESFDALTGAPQWRHAYPTAYRDDFGFDEGPRAVPVVAEGIVFTYGAEGKLHAVELATGKLVVEYRCHAAVRRRRRVFLVPPARRSSKKERCLANVGGKKAGIVAFDAKSGKVLWTATDDSASYSSATGRDDWRTPLRDFPDPQRACRARSGDRDPPVSARLARQAGRVGQCGDAGRGRQRDLRVGRVWAWCRRPPVGRRRSWSMCGRPTTCCRIITRRASTTTAISTDFTAGRNSGRIFRAVDLETGKVRGAKTGLAPGSVTLAGNRLLIVRESGELILAVASPNAFQPIAKARRFSRQRSARIRRSPMDSVYIRNDNTLVALDLTMSGTGSGFLGSSFVVLACGSVRPAAQSPQALLNRRGQPVRGRASLRSRRERSTSSRNSSLMKRPVVAAGHRAVPRGPVRRLPPPVRIPSLGQPR